MLGTFECNSGLIYPNEGGQSSDGLYRKYWDNIGGLWTIGIGFTDAVFPNSTFQSMPDVMNQAECDAIFTERLSSYEGWTQKIACVKNNTCQLSAHQIACMYDIEWQWGAGFWTMYTDGSKLNSLADIRNMLANNSYLWQYRNRSQNRLNWWDTPDSPNQTPPPKPPTTENGTQKPVPEKSPQKDKPSITPSPPVIKKEKLVIESGYNYLKNNMVWNTKQGAILSRSQDTLIPLIKKKKVEDIQSSPKPTPKPDNNTVGGGSVPCTLLKQPTIQKKISPYNHHSGNTVKYIVIHDVGVSGSTAKNNADYFFGGDRQASAHYFVDESEIWQSVEEQNGAWHVGDGYNKNGINNSNSIGIEMCVKENKIQTKTQDNCLALVFNLMKKYNVSKDRIVRHYDASGKNCPQFLNTDGNWSGWKEFKARIDKGNDCKNDSQKPNNGNDTNLIEKFVNKLASVPLQSCYYKQGRPQPNPLICGWMDCSGYIGWGFEDIFPDLWNGGKDLHTGSINSFFRKRGNVIDEGWNVRTVIARTKPKRGDVMLTGYDSQTGWGNNAHVVAFIDSENVIHAGDGAVPKISGAVYMDYNPYCVLVRWA